MLESIKTWIVTVLIGAFIVNIVDMILPSSKIKPYINLVVNFIFVFIILTPIANFFSKDMSLEDKILKYMSEYNKQYVDSVNGLADKTGNNSLSKGYEDGLKEVLKLKLNEYGYELDEIELEGNKIGKISVKDKIIVIKVKMRTYNLKKMKNQNRYSMKKMNPKILNIVWT